MTHDCKVCMVCGWTKEHPPHQVPTAFQYQIEGTAKFLIPLIRRLGWKRRVYFKRENDMEWQKGKAYDLIL